MSSSITVMNKFFSLSLSCQHDDCQPWKKKNNNNKLIKTLYIFSSVSLYMEFSLSPYFNPKVFPLHIIVWFAYLCGRFRLKIRMTEYCFEFFFWNRKLLLLVAKEETNLSHILLPVIYIFFFDYWIFF